MDEEDRQRRKQEKKTDDERKVNELQISAEDRAKLGLSAQPSQ